MNTPTSPSGSAPNSAPFTTLDLGTADTNTHAALLVAGHALRHGGREGVVDLFGRWAPGHAAELRQALDAGKGG